MRLSLDSHPEQYNLFVVFLIKGVRALSKVSPRAQGPALALTLACLIPLVAVLIPLFGGLEYSRRHLYVADLSHSLKEKAWHVFLAGAEAIPVLGPVVACVECAVYENFHTDSEYLPLWKDGNDPFHHGNSVVRHWTLISSIRKDTKLDDLKGCDFDRTEDGDMAILCAAAYVGNIDLIFDIIPTMSDFASAEYHSPLIYAIVGQQPDALKALLQVLPDAQEHLIRLTLTGRNRLPVTPLWLAAQKLQDVSLVKPLLQARIDISDAALTAQGIDEQGKAVIQRAAKELAEESQLMQNYIQDKNVIDSIINLY